MSLFDELVARYRNMNYGNLSGNNPSAVRSLLDEYNDRTYTQVLDPSQVTYLGDVPQNQWFYDDRNHLQFGMPGEGVQGGLIGDGTTGTTGWPTYDPYTDYGDPGYAGLIPGEGGTGTGTTAQTRPQIGGGRDPVTGLSQASFTGNPDGTVSFSRNRLGSDTFTYNPDQQPNEEGYIEAYDEYGRKRNLKVNLLTRMFTKLSGLLEGDQDIAEATQISSRQPGLDDYSQHETQENYNLREGFLGPGFAESDQGSPTTGDPEPGAPFGQPMGGQQDDGSPTTGDPQPGAPFGGGQGNGQNGGPAAGGPVGGSGFAGGHHI